MLLHSRHGLWLLVLPFLFAVGRAQSPVTVTFDPPPSGGGSYIISSYSQNGVLFTSDLPDSFAHYSPDHFGYPQNGTAYLAVMREYAGFSHESSLFRLNSIDVAEYSRIYPGPTSVRFTGYRADGLVVSASFVTDGIFDGTGPLPDFQTFTFDATFSDLLRIQISPGIMIDNVGITPVPEPSFVALFVLSLAGLLGTQMARPRRRKGLG